MGSDLMLIDGHNDLAWAHREAAAYHLDVLDVGRAQPSLHTDLPRLRAGGVRGQFWSVYVPTRLTGEAAVNATREQVAFVHTLADRYDAFSLAVNADQVESTVADGRIACLMGMEGGHSIDSSLDVLAEMYESGVRYMTLTHTDNLPWADSATDDVVLGGLNDFGREVVATMNRLGMIVDLSHVSAATMRDALSCTAAPVIFSHSNALALCDTPRNVPDDVLKTLAGNGGVCMATFVPFFTAQACADWFAECQAVVAARGLSPWSLSDVDDVMDQRMLTETPPHSTLDDVADHIEYLRDVAGIDHVGIGGDFDGTMLLTEGLEDVSCYPALFDVLRVRRWSESDLDLLAGRNVLRVLRDVEYAAR